MAPPGGEARAREFFARTPFVVALGIEVTGWRDGECETGLVLAPWQLQHHGWAHACVVAALADHGAGGAAFGAIAGDHDAITAEFKINFLRGAAGPRLRGRSRPVHVGRRIVVVESDVFGGDERLCAKALVTLAVRPHGERSAGA
jgi:uncharacterized protein (TIGR00369 family)